MIILPLIQRELRARVRRRVIYWSRFAVALAGVVLCLQALNLAVGPTGSSQAMLGHWAFQSIVTAAFILSCCAGFLTVEGISRERQEGTLGLLYLTRVKALDVLLGSFGAAGITCVCALVALAPVVMLPVLAGGVTGGEAWRTMLVLLDALLLSLAAGLWAAAGVRGWFKSARSLAGLLLLVIVAPILTVFWKYVLPLNIEMISPLGALQWAADGVYQLNPPRYWASLAVVQGISWLLLIAAGFRLRRAMREGDGMTESTGAVGRKPGAARQPAAGPDDPATGRAFTLVAWKIGPRKMADTDDPVRWLVRRQRGVKAVVWAGVLVGVIPYAAGLLMNLAIARFSAATIIRLLSLYGSHVSLAVSVVQGSLFGWAASRFLAEARRTGELELLLTTPVGAKTIVSSLWKELRRLFLVPVIILAVPSFVLSLYYRSAAFTSPAYQGLLSYRLYSALTPLLSSVNTILDAGALIWAGLWFGLRARSPAGAILRIVLLARGVPYVMMLAGSSLLRLVVSNSTVYFAGGVRSAWWRMLYWLNPVAACCYSLWLIRWARRRLAAELTNPSPDEFSWAEAMARARAGLNAFVKRARSWPPAPEG